MQAKHHAQSNAIARLQSELSKEFSSAQMGSILAMPCMAVQPELEPNPVLSSQLPCRLHEEFAPTFNVTKN